MLNGQDIKGFVTAAVNESDP